MLEKKQYSWCVVNVWTSGLVDILLLFPWWLGKWSEVRNLYFKLKGSATRPRTRKTTNYLKCTLQCIDECRGGEFKARLDRDEKRVTHEGMDRQATRGAHAQGGCIISLMRCVIAAGLVLREERKWKMVRGEDVRFGQDITCMEMEMVYLLPPELDSASDKHVSPRFTCSLTLSLLSFQLLPSTSLETDAQGAKWESQRHRSPDYTSV